jgi:TolB-like protein/Tfp pilus assembly protein PilF
LRTCSGSARAPSRDWIALRHALSDLDQAGGAWRLERERHSVRLDTTGCWIDAFEIPDRAELLLDDLYGVSVNFDQWLQAERVRYEARWHSALEQKIVDLIAQNAPPAQRAAAARELLALLPTSEIAVRTLMSAFVDMDERAEAIRAFERHRMLADADGLPVSQQSFALYSAIRTIPSISSRQASSGRLRERVNSQTGEARLPAKASHADVDAVASAGILEPSIAVLPLRNISGSEGRDFIIEGITEDLVETLSRVPGLFVVSRLSAAIFRSQVRSPQEIGTALGVRYLLSGSVRIIDNRIRLIIELAEAETGRGLWRYRFDEKTTAILEAQSGLAEAVVRALALPLRSAELKRTRIKNPDDYTAYDFFLRAQENMHSTSRPVFEAAEKLLDTAIDRDPHYATALAWRAYWHVMRVGQGWSPDRAVDTSLAETFAQRAIECDPFEAMAFAVHGHAAAYLRKDFDLAFACFERALEINPNSARACLWSANAHSWTCEGAAAVEKITRAMALSPYDPLMCAYFGSASLAYFADKQYERAIEFAMRSIRENRSYSAPYKLLIPALVLSGRVADAKGAANQLLRLEPGLTVAQFRRRSPVAVGGTGELVCECLATAGVPVSE